jgi:hypothetical protein
MNYITVWMLMLNVNASQNSSITSWSSAIASFIAIKAKFSLPLCCYLQDHSLTNITVAPQGFRYCHATLVNINKLLWALSVACFSLCPSG